MIMKKIFVGLTLALLVAVVALIFTKPTESDHRDAVRRLALEMVNEQIPNVPLMEDLQTLTTMAAINVVEEQMTQSLRVEEFGILNVGVMTYKGHQIIVSVGAADRVWLTVDKELVASVIGR